LLKRLVWYYLIVLHLYQQNGTTMTHTTITTEFVAQLATELKNANGGWLDMNSAPKCEVGYSVTPFENGDVIVKFDAAVTFDGSTARRWKLYPVSKRKPEGKLSAIRA
jgi:hypothetical protein